jgi:hypothetical protein
MFCYITKKSLFPLGKILIAPAIEHLGIEVQRLLRRHESGDFGCIDPYDSDQNLKAIKSGEGILSQYDVMVGQDTILIAAMTESDRSYTVVFILNKSKLDLPDLPEGKIPPGSEHS